MFGHTAFRDVMTIELQMLALSVALGLVHIFAAAYGANLQHGYRWGLSSRDQPLPPLHGVAGRLDRALRNFLETFPLFAAVVLTAHVMEQHNSLTVWGVQMYFWARAAYLPLYAAGVPVLRSLAWNVATLGIMFILVALFQK